MKIKILFLAALIIVGLQSQGQDYNYNNLAGGNLNVITTAVPFLIIAPDARSGAMGDAGVSSSPDVYSMHWNPAKYAVMEKDMSIGLAYSPWLRNLVPDMNLAYLAFHKRIDNMSAVAATLRYFSLGDIQFTDIEGNPQGTYSPNEWAIDATYSRKLTDKLSGAVVGRFIYSNLTQGQFVQGAATSAGISVAADVAVYWQDDVEWFNDIDAQFAWGVNISNIGNKLGYSEASIKKDFIPTNLRFGPTLTLELDDYNTIAFSVDFNKLLVPTPPIYKRDSSGNNIPIPGTDKFEILAGMDDDVSVVGGMIQSFYDAPDGFSEEMRELSIAVGTEYWYNEVFALRGGFFYEDESKGNRKFFTLGAGLRYNVFGLDFSYLIPIDSRNNPLQNTLRFALTFDLGAGLGK
ncbi:MAG: type IX secretion system outer membrane channel protein PorV [Bacteroidetes bacterium]|nr:type IX secretion system outer membrane channel protein PorV [Bacteroidota bacterium]MBU1579811.1 type IX secretion system outer membrane channel protein PorV [Bacteroidota bacterium]MBU2556349.1 type IX secretion system outer membrane channel protein PorV [Bacteroidota bacterium]